VLDCGDKMRIRAIGSQKVGNEHRRVTNARVNPTLRIMSAVVILWGADWVWGLPLILLTVVIHVFGLGIINERVVLVLGRTIDRRRLIPMFAMVMGAAVLLMTALHAVEAAAWAGAYRILGALPDTKSAMLYSLSAMTTYGHANLFLEPHWQMMGALEALNGMLLFGLTTAFLFAMIQEVWPIRSRERRSPH
jgi:hypothetical protein